MAKQITSWEDSRGGLHRKESDALLVDIECALGGYRHGTEGHKLSMTPGIAKLIADNSEPLEELLKKWNRLQRKAQAAPPLPEQPVKDTSQ